MINPEDKKFVLRYPKKWDSDIKELANKRHVSSNSIIVQAIERELKDNDFLKFLN